MTVHTDNGDMNTIAKDITCQRNENTIFSFWVDKDLSRGTVLDMKIILYKTTATGTVKSLVNTELGEHFAVVVGSVEEDSTINQTN